MDYIALTYFTVTMSYIAWGVTTLVQWQLSDKRGKKAAQKWREDYEAEEKDPITGRNLDGTVGIDHLRVPSADDRFNL